MHYSIICFKNQAMFALIKKDCYYGVTTDLNFVLLDNKTKKSRNRCVSTASRLFLWSEWRDLNSRPLDPQSSALPAAPHPVVPKLNLLSAYRLSADSPRRFLQKHSRGTSLGALVPLLVSSPRSNAFIRHRRRHFSSPSCATPGKLINNTTRKAF